MSTYKQGTARAPGLIYRIGTASMVIGFLVSLCSGMLGGIVFAATIGLLDSLGAPEDRNYFSPNEPQTGTEVLLLFGIGIFLSGFFIFSSRLLMELLGFPVDRHLSRGFALRAKLVAGMTSISTLIFIPSVMLLFVLEEAFYENPAEALTSILNLIGMAGLWLMIGGWIIYLMMRPERIPNIFGWMVVFGWGKLGCSLVNFVASVMILLAIIFQLFSWNSIFGLTMNMIVGTGFVMILTGIIPHFLARGKF